MLVSSSGGLQIPTKLLLGVEDHDRERRAGHVPAGPSHLHAVVAGLGGRKLWTMIQHKNAKLYRVNGTEPAKANSQIEEYMCEYRAVQTSVVSWKPGFFETLNQYSPQI